MSSLRDSCLKLAPSPRLSLEICVQVFTHHNLLCLSWGAVRASKPHFGGQRQVSGAPGAGLWALSRGPSRSCPVTTRHRLLHVLPPVLLRVGRLLSHLLHPHPETLGHAGITQRQLRASGGAMSRWVQLGYSVSCFLFLGLFLPYKSSPYCDGYLCVCARALTCSLSL